MISGLRQQVLRTDASGMPIEWINYQQAVKYYALDQIAYTCGSRLHLIHGGINSLTRKQSIIEVNSIIATRGYSQPYLNRDTYTAPLCNHTLFARDAYLCMYCGGQFKFKELSRDHITPLSQGGQNTWNNVITACKRCNHHKGGRTPEEAGMQLLAVPFSPSHAEYIYLQAKHVLMDQMEFLLAHFPRTSPLHQRLVNKPQN